MPAAPAPRRAAPQRTAPRPAPKQQVEETEPEQDDQEDQDQFAEDPFSARDDQSEGEVDQDAVFDLSETPDEAPRELLAPGVYEAIVQNVEYGTSRRSGNPMLTWTFTATDKEGKEHTLWYHTVLNDERGLVRTKKTISRLLTDDEEFDFAQFKPGEVADWAVGRPCRIVVRIQPATAEYDKSNAIRDVLAPAEAFLS